MEFYYWLRKPAIKSIGSVTCIIKIDGDESVDVSTKIRVNAKNWDQAEKCFIGKDAARNEKDLKQFERRIKDVYEEILSEYPKAPVNPNEVVKRHREGLKGDSSVRQRKIHLFRECMREYLLHQSELVNAERLSVNTFDALLSKRIIIEKYLSNNKLLNIKGEDVNEKFMEDFKMAFIKEKYSDSTIAKYLIFIKSTLTFSRKRELIRFTPIESYRIEQPEQNDPIYPTERELQRMIEAAITPNHEKVMDIYCFCCYTSLSYSDYIELSNENLEFDEDGTRWIYSDRSKTSVSQRIPLLEERILDLIEKYGGDLANIPKLSNAYLNTCIKEIANLANVKKHLTFHSSRKYFVDYAYNHLGMSMENIIEIVGWTSSRMFKKYATVKTSTIKNDWLKNRSLQLQE